jgi:hypothetical protein
MRQQILSFMVSRPGRLIRAVGGIALLIYGLFLSGFATGYIMAIVGLFMFATASGDICFMASRCGLPTEGAQTRAALHKGE